MSTYHGKDNCTDVILDFIAGGSPENPGGESGGNYNAVIGHVKGLPGVDLATMTITQVYALESQLVSEGEPSSAIGRYQDIKATLQSLVSKQGVDPNTTLLTDLEQDELNVELLVTACKYSQWYTGKITDEEFAHLISLQWASLPDPQNDGKSHYDGVGPNHAGTSLEHVYMALERARQARPSVAPTPGGTPVPAPTSPVKGKPVSIISTIVEDALKGVNWLEQAQSGTTDSESIGPLLIKTALDGFRLATGGGSIMQLISDIEADIPAALAAFRANNTEQAPVPVAAPPA